MYYPCSENKNADQLRSYCEADQRLCFRLCKLLVFPWDGSFLDAYTTHYLSRDEPVYKVNDLRNTPFINIVILIWHSTVEMIQTFKSEKAIYTRFCQNENT